MLYENLCSQVCSQEKKDVSISCLYETKTLVWYYVASTAMVTLTFVHKVDLLYRIIYFA